MTQYKLNEIVIKFVAPLALKRELQRLAQARNVSLSALIRLILSEYVKSKG
jgi:predicted transcriptional regulator